MESVKIKDKILQIPIIQGGMGVGVSLSNLAKAVMENHGMGVISAAMPGYKQENFSKDNKNVNYNFLIEEIKKAKAHTNNGLLGVNLMVVVEDYNNLVKASILGGADAIISGAGMPLNLPELTQGSDIALAPIVSSGRVAKIICAKWDKKYNYIPDFIVIEGPQAGGHLGFKLEEIENDVSLLDILDDVLKTIKPFEEKYERKIPVFVAGGIFDGKDIARAIKRGASGVQMGTRFIATKEADCHINYKNAIVESTKEDITIIKSPVGLPGRALLTPLVQRLQNSKETIKKCYDCIITCDPAKSDYCISSALISSASGDKENGLFFCGSKAYLIDKIVSVKTLMDELVSETDLALNEQ